MLQFPGVYQDSTSQGDFHVRNEHGNVQYRINGILLPDGVSGFSQILETSFIGNMRLLTGALPAQYGLHTSGVIDITSKSGAALAGGSVSVYGGSRQTSITSDQNWYDTLSGRIGYVMGPLMLYGKGGAAWMNADYRMEVNSGLDGVTSTNTTRPGWVAGAGLEYMLGSRWSAKLEYDHLDFGKKTLGFVNPFGNSVTVESAVNQVKAGVNYHFDGLLSF